MTAVDVGDALGAVARDGDFVAFDEVLGGLDDLGRTAARAWYRGNRTRLARLAQGTSSRPMPCAPTRSSSSTSPRSRSPEQAAKWFGFTAWGRSENVRTDLVVGQMVANGPDWCARFLDAACGLRFSGENDYDVRKLAVYGVPVLGWFGLPVPEHPMFGRAWAMRLRFLLYAAVWDAPQRQAPPAQRVVPRDGWDPALVTSVVRGEDGALTRDDTAGTQKVLSALLAATGFGPDDGRDRVPRLQGVLATARAPVVSVVLPALLPVVQDAGELAELASTVPLDADRVERDNPRLVAARALVAAGEVRAADGGWVMHVDDHDQWVRPGADGLTCACL